VYLHVFPDNEAAIRLYERVGFAREGVLRRHVSKRGRSRDVVVMAAVRDDG
jgi:putative acetyltransferase